MSNYPVVYSSSVPDPNMTPEKLKSLVEKVTYEWTWHVERSGGAILVEYQGPSWQLRIKVGR
jgi:hypothetical protein